LPVTTFIGLGVLAACAAPTSTSAFLPDLVLWAWERPEDLRFLDPDAAAVAVLAGTLTLTGPEVDVTPRRQPLLVPVGTALIAVVRIESATALRPVRGETPRLDDAQRAAAREQILDLARLDGVRAVQVDFDAALSERGFYAALLVELRRALPAEIGLSVTALASWCLDDPWLAGAPLDERTLDDAVPMLFRMGTDDAFVRRRLAAGEDFRPECRRSAGLSTDEPWPRLPAGRRLYVFHPEPWSPAAWDALCLRLAEAVSPEAA
jgi:hypothetical protein